jgi:hypothetical protein
MGTRAYVLNDKRMDFSFSAFRRVFDTYRREKGITGSKLEEQIAEHLKISAETVHGWHYSKNTPSSIKDIESLATPRQHGTHRWIHVCHPRTGHATDCF